MRSREAAQGVAPAESVFVVGLGRFGASMASTLVELDIEVMAVDIDQKLVDHRADELTHVRLADATDSATLKQLGAAGFDAAVVAIGTGMEASILSTAALRDVGVDNIWAKALSDEHGRILERIGADHVVYPERQMGERVARLVTGHFLDYFQIDEGFVLAELEAPEELLGATLGDSDIRSRFGVTVVCVKPELSVFTYATVDTVPRKGDVLVVAGEVKAVERFLDFAAG
ncbi:MAG: TrkA family potassium uptake protein [Acidimicrobiia bacterium]|nr:TrkA family potassium uptake protein [Acidimicrobiia bacterium]